MKTQSLPIMALLAISLSGFAHWEVQNPRPTIQNLSDVCLVTPAVGYAVGLGGTLVKTTDSGSHWELLTSNIAADLTALSFIDVLTGFAAGAGGTVIKTTDGGLHWNNVNLSPDMHLTDVRMVSANEGWVAGVSPDGVNMIFHTTNGGITWEVQYNKPSSTIPRICFTDEIHGWALASGSLLLNTNDGGITWENEYYFDSLNTHSYMSDICFSDTLNGWAKGYNDLDHHPIIARTSDGGHTWNNLGMPGTSFLTSVYTIDSLHAWVSGDGIFYTCDGGVTWETQLSGLASGLAAIHSCDGSHLLAAGAVGVIFSSTDGGGNWNPQAGTVTYQNLNSLCFSGSQEGWSAGSAGTIIHTTNKGNTWENQSSGTNRNLLSVSFPDTLHGWVAGDTGTILHTSDGGITWLQQTSGSLKPLRTISFMDDQHGWTVGDTGTILHTRDGGTTWISQQSNTTASLVSLSFPDSLHGWAAGNMESYWVLLRTTNGGTTWHEQANSSAQTDDGVTEIFFADSLRGWMLSWYYGPGRPDGNSIITIVKYTSDGGNTWTNQLTPFGMGRGIYFLDTLNGWIAGLGFCHHTRNGGQTWEKLSDLPYLPVQDIIFTDINNGWIVGSNGVVMHTDHAGIFVSSMLLDKALCVNDSVAFEGSVCGIPPILLQWQKNGSNIQGAISQVYPIPHVLPGDSGLYRYYISNVYGSDTSNTALLNVHYIPPAHIYGDTSVAPYQAETYSVIPEHGHNYNFSCTGGNLIDLTDSSIMVHWGIKGPGTINLFETDELYCTGDSVRLEILIQNMRQEEITNYELRIMNWPNPFDGKTIFSYSLDEPADVVLQIFNSFGQLVDESVKRYQQKGDQKIEWNSGNLPAAIYFYLIQAGNQAGSGKLMKY